MSKILSGQGYQMNFEEPTERAILLYLVMWYKSGKPSSCATVTSIDLTTFAVGQATDQESPETLAELFAGRVGGVHGGGKAWSEDTGEAFSEGMARKFSHNKGQSTL